jgi:ketosteroid isomerase-like protein
MLTSQSSEISRSNEPEAQQVAQEILELERVALVRWCSGDPSGFLEISAPDIVYVDPFIDARIDGLPSLCAYYEGLRGKISAERFEIINPVVQHTGDVAVCTFNFVCYPANQFELRWNCTEVYRRDASGWRVIQTHWSLTNPKR